MKSSWQSTIDKYPKDINSILNVIEEKRALFDGVPEIYPIKDNIFKCFEFAEIQETKVVIIGQDPYHGPNQATGLAFGVNSDTKVPPSLRNIINELASDLSINLQDTSLEKWANQGVLLMNASLSVIQGKPGSQLKLWCDFTDYIIHELNKLDNIIFVAWGAFAYNKFSLIDTNKHTLIVSSHPSPLSNSKPFKQFPPFKGSKPFSKINEKLLKLGKTPIDW